MSETGISPEKAKTDFASCAAYIVERITNADSKAEATADLVKHYLSLDDVDSAANFADALADPFARDAQIIEVIAKCVDLNDDQYAAQLIEVVSDPGLKARAKSAKALRLAKRGDFEKAQTVADSIEQNFDTLAGIAFAMAMAGQDESAKETVRGMDYYSPRVGVSSQIASAMFDQDRKESAMEWIELADLEAGEIDFQEERIRARNEIGDVFLKLGESAKGGVNFAKAAEEASQLESVQGEGLMVVSAIGLLKCGEIDAADEVLDGVVDKALLADCLAGFSLYYQQNEEPEDAVEAIEESLAMLNSQTDYEIRDTAMRNRIYATVAIQFHRVGLTQRAVEIAHENEDGSRRNEALLAIGQLMILAGDSTGAEEVGKGVEPESERVATFIGLSDAANTHEDRELAVRYTIAAQNLLDEVEQHIVRADISDEIALRLNAYGLQEDAAMMARNNVSLIADIRDEGAQAAALLRLSRVYKKIGIEPAESELAVLETIVRKIDW